MAFTPVNNTDIGPDTLKQGFQKINDNYDVLSASTGAANVGFDNTISGLAAANTQEAIDSLAASTAISVLDDLTDVTAPSPTAGQALIYDVSGYWIPGTASTVVDLDDLGDVTVPSPTAGQVLMYNVGGFWEAQTADSASALNDLTDVDVPAPNNGDALIYNSVSGNWEAQTSASTSALNDLTDVNTAGVQTGDALVYNGSSWVPGPGTAISVVSTGTTPYNITDEDILVVNTLLPTPGNKIVNLPAGTADQIVTIKSKSYSSSTSSTIYNLTINANGAESIDNGADTDPASSLVLVPGDSVKLVYISADTTWWII